MLQDLAFRGLGKPFNDTVVNCTTDCGPNGVCPPASYVLLARGEIQSSKNSTYWTQCVCSPPWTGKKCERATWEVDSQLVLTRGVVAGLQELVSTSVNREALGLGKVLGPLVRLFKLLTRLANDCRRVPLEVLASIASMAVGLAGVVSKVELLDASSAAGALLTQLYTCLPEDRPKLPMATMPAPASVILSALGRSQVCRLLKDSNTTLCYDLASSEVRVTCPTPAAETALQSSIFNNSSGNGNSSFWILL
ncbi:unnamed protein product [Polarella glacialis]|uniref:EGF-like domain-containing protein n=1 Tax=Polarella glacialis TaxID=89957 RepID=A0A813JWK3_POLGL|nr:unnamed protein product [Polarella glacialis]CAE8718803.1 unnamed protein product [Polarella glacialis]